MLFHFISSNEYVDKVNQTFSGEFLLLGLTFDAHIQVDLFLWFLLVYIVTVVGNISIILIVRISPMLHIPMYFFLSHLSFSDLCYSSVITPKLLEILIMEDKSITYSSCMTQLTVFSVFGSMECLILALMACDRSVAVRKPLFYHLIMTDSLCKQLIASSYSAAVMTSLLNAAFALQLSFCSENSIDHFYCDYPPLLKLSCSDTSTNELVLLVSVSCVSGISVVTILISYGYIILTVLGIRSKEGRHKVFYTCSSHLMVVSVFYGTVLFMYLRPSGKSFSDQDKVVAVFYTVIIPILNPIIYSMRNKELQLALQKIILRMHDVV
ncbi:olfactory receptor 8D1-like [Pelobates fuscus]|uniref:olfactory receptor 8D1-like n=1 Tax=Pelobates fuscus TaxID=191477 RepID=UPI002FE4C5E9